jgi:hypothetical protein
MRTLMIAAAVVMFTAVGTAAAAQDHAAHAAHASPAAQAFEHYEGVRAALAADTMADVAPHARQLAASVDAFGGPEAKQAADALAAAKTIDDARKHFGALSTILVPKFQEAGLEGANAYYCAMKKLPWMQRGDAVENPYYGKAMLKCGEPLPPGGKPGGGKT